VGVIVQRNNGRGTMAGGAPMAWCSGLGRGKMETWLSSGESGQCLDYVFIAVEGGSRAVR
jgi:hypothetical protein